MKYENIIFNALATEAADHGWNEYAMANAALESVDAEVGEADYMAIQKIINRNLAPVNFTQMAEQVAALILRNNMRRRSVFSNPATLISTGQL